MTPGICHHTVSAGDESQAWEWSQFAAIRTTLDNGLRVILSENHTVPLVFLSWTSRAGFECDPPGIDGLASMTPLLLRDGTARRTALQITRELEDLGIDVAAGSDWDSAFVNFGLLAGDLAAGTDLLLDMASAPRFSDASVARARQRRLIELARRRQDVRAIANDELARALFGADLYGRPPLGTAETVQRIAAADVAAFHDAHYGTARSYFAVAGSFDTAHVVELLGSYPLPRALASPAPERVAPVAPAQGPALRIVDVPRAAETEIRVGCAAAAWDSEDLPALEVLDSILGGGPSSRLAARLRQHHGLTYHVRTRVAARRLAGTFAVETTVSTDAAASAVEAIRSEIERVCLDLVSRVDVERAKQALFVADLRRFQDLIGTGATLGRLALQADPVSHLERRRHAIAAVEPDALRDTARRYVNPERLVAVVAGPGDALTSQFSSGGAHTCSLRPLESRS